VTGVELSTTGAALSATGVELSATGVPASAAGVEPALLESSLQPTTNAPAAIARATDTALNRTTFSLRISDSP
jgi:hypothetical protein